jgi:ribosome-associated translation inhibitor RaiA
MSFVEHVELVKFPELDEVDSSILEKNFERFLSKVILSDEDKLILNVKEYAKGGLRRQHEIKARLSISGKFFSASDTGWQLLETVQNVLKKLEKEVLKSTSK